MKKISHSYFVVMIDHGQRGLEAIVHPEDTRRKVVEMIASGELKDIAFIHAVEGLYLEDVTAELIGKASFANAMDAIDGALAASQAFNRDRARDYAKETV